MNRKETKMTVGYTESEKRLCLLSNLYRFMNGSDEISEEVQDILFNLSFVKPESAGFNTYAVDETGRTKEVGILINNVNVSALYKDCYGVESVPDKVTEYLSTLCRDRREEFSGCFKEEAPETFGMKVRKLIMRL